MSGASVDAAVAQAARWLREQAEHTPFGTVSVSLTLHAGAVSRVEQARSETCKPGNGGDYGQQPRR